MNLTCMSDPTAQIVYRHSLKHSDPVKRDPIGSILKYKPEKKRRKSKYTGKQEKRPHKKPWKLQIDEIEKIGLPASILTVESVFLVLIFTVHRAVAAPEASAKLPTESDDDRELPLCQKWINVETPKLSETRRIGIREDADTCRRLSSSIGRREIFPFLSAVVAAASPSSSSTRERERGTERGSEREILLLARVGRDAFVLFSLFNVTYEITVLPLTFLDNSAAWEDDALFLLVLWREFGVWGPLSCWVGHTSMISVVYIWPSNPDRMGFVSVIVMSCLDGSWGSLPPQAMVDPIFLIWVVDGNR